MTTSHRTLNRNFLRIEFVIACANPLIPLAPPIDAAVIVVVNRLTREVEFGGVHDAFPAYELYVQFDEEPPQPLYTYRDDTKTPFDLMSVGRVVFGQNVFDTQSSPRTIPRLRLELD